MGIFDKFSIPNLTKKKMYELDAPKYSPIIGQASTFKVISTFNLDMDIPKFEGDIPRAEIKSYEDFR